MTHVSRHLAGRPAAFAHLVARGGALFVLVAVWCPLSASATVPLGYVQGLRKRPVGLQWGAGGQCDDLVGHRSTMPGWRWAAG